MAENWLERAITPEEAVLHGGCAASLPLEAALAARARTLRGLEVCQMHKEGPESLLDPPLAEQVRVRAFFCGPTACQAVQEGRADFVPVFLSDITTCGPEPFRSTWRSSSSRRHGRQAGPRRPHRDVLGRDGRPRRPRRRYQRPQDLRAGRTATSFVIGTRKTYDFVHDNPAVVFHPSDVMNDTHLIRQQPRMTAINCAIEVDLTGQVCADSIGPLIFSGIGGQMDFIRGAALAPGGKAIIALPSTAKGGTISRISATLAAGAGVVTTRGHVQYVVTEHRVADLRGRSLRERADALIAIADPAHRPDLLAAARARRLFAVAGR